MSTDLTVLPKTDPESPYYTKIPTYSQPTEILSKRFELWRQIIKSLIQYFKTIAISSHQFANVNLSVVNSISFPFFTNLVKTGNESYEITQPLVENSKKQSFFSDFGSASIQDVQILLKKYHLNLYQQQRERSVKLQETVSRLEELQKDLVIKIREIRNLHGDFKNDINSEIAITGQALNDYIQSIKNLVFDKNELSNAKYDPFLKRIRLELQLKQQLDQENYLEEAYINLQITALELEKIIFKEIKESLNNYCELISKEIFVHYNDLINELNQGLISKADYFEWDNFITKDTGKNLLPFKHDDKLPIPRSLKNVKYPFNNSIVSKTIRSGYLFKKSKYLKTYTKSFFILTLNYLHEFKNDKLNENLTPLNSINLNDCILSESNDTKFQLHVSHITNKLPTHHNSVFKNVNDDVSTFKKWIVDLKQLTSFNTFEERFEFMTRKYQKDYHKQQEILLKQRLQQSDQTNSLQPSTTNPSSHLLSGSQTPRLEISNPMDLSEINAKLENLQIDTDKLSNTTNNVVISPIPTPSITNNNNNLTVTGIQTPKLLSTNSSPNSIQQRITPKLSLSTNTVPSLEIQEPTPIRPTMERFPSQSSVHSVKSVKNPSIHSISRSSTPFIGHQREGSNPQDLKTIPFDLNQPLYNENDGDQSDQTKVDLSELLKR